MKKNSNIKVIIFYIVLFVAVIVALAIMFSQNQKTELTLSQVEEYFADGMVQSFVIDKDNNDFLENAKVLEALYERLDAIKASKK